MQSFFERVTGRFQPRREVDGQWTDGGRQALLLTVCRRAASLPSCSFFALTDKWLIFYKPAIKPSKCYRDKPRLRVAANHTLCSDQLETAQCPLAAVGETVHCPAVAAADSSREQTDRPPGSPLLLLLLLPPPSPFPSPSPLTSASSISFSSVLYPSSHPFIPFYIFTSSSSLPVLNQQNVLLTHWQSILFVLHVFESIWALFEQLGRWGHFNTTRLSLNTGNQRPLLDK